MQLLWNEGLAQDGVCIYHHHIFLPGLLCLRINKSICLLILTQHSLPASGTPISANRGICNMQGIISCELPEEQLTEQGRPTSGWHGTVKWCWPDPHSEPGSHSKGLVVGCVVVIMLFIILHIWDDIGGHEIQPSVVLQLLAGAAQQPRQRPWLPCSPEAACKDPRFKGGLASSP
jgi:hypothetical protein